MRDKRFVVIETRPRVARFLLARGGRHPGGQASAARCNCVFVPAAGGVPGVCSVRLVSEVMSGEGGKEEEMEPFTMITKEDVAGASAGLLGTFSTGKTWIQVS